jgi:hypothetical protein
MRDLLVALVNAYPASGKQRGAPPGPASQVVGSELR